MKLVSGGYTRIFSSSVIFFLPAQKLSKSIPIVNNSNDVTRIQINKLRKRKALRSMYFRLIELKRKYLQPPLGCKTQQTLSMGLTD